MALIQACIFDLDGVLVDTARYHFQAWRRLAAEWEYTLTEAANEKLKGISRAESLELLLQWAGVELSAYDKAEALRRKNEWYLELVDTMRPDELLPGVAQFLQLLRERNIQIALGSASKNARLILEKVQLLPFFDAIIDGNQVQRGKPDPQTFSLGAAALEVPPVHCVVFEDASAGVQAACEAGMYAVGVGNPKVLQQAHIVIPGFEQVNLKLFDALP